MKKAFFFLILLFGVNIPSLYYGWYLKFNWVDVILHFLGGFFVAMFMADYLKDRFIPREWIKNTLIIAGATIFIGVVWEFAEFIANQTLAKLLYRWFSIMGYFMGDLNDTVLDLLMDIIGSLTLTSFYSLKNRRGSDPL